TTTGGRPLRLARATDLLAGIACGLDAVACARPRPRDVKPESVPAEAGTDRPGLVELRLTLDLTTLDGDVIEGGTPEYMAPELFEHKVFSAASAVYAFACTAYEVLTGERPFCGPSVADLRVQHATAVRPRASWTRPGLAPV